MFYYALATAGEIAVKRIVAVAVLAVASFAGVDRARAQEATPSPVIQHAISDAELEMLRADIRSQKKQLIAQTLKLTDDEATRFWPVYDQYAADLAKVNDRKLALLQRYADQFQTLTDEQALDLLKQWLAVETEINQLREKYVPTVSKAVSGKAAASFFQIERRASMLADLQLSRGTPLAQGKK